MMLHLFAKLLLFQDMSHAHSYYTDYYGVLMPIRIASAAALMSAQLICLHASTELPIHSKIASMSLTVP